MRAAQDSLGTRRKDGQDRTSDDKILQLLMAVIGRVDGVENMLASEFSKLTEQLGVLSKRNSLMIKLLVELAGRLPIRSGKADVAQTADDPEPVTDRYATSKLSHPEAKTTDNIRLEGRQKNWRVDYEAQSREPTTPYFVMVTTRGNLSITNKD